MNNKKQFTVIIEETISQSFDVFAQEEHEAVIIAKQQYDKGNFVLEPGNLIRKRMLVDDEESGVKSEWLDF